MLNHLKENINALIAFLASTTWGKAREVVEKRADRLLDSSIDTTIELVALCFRGDAHAASVVQAHRHILQRCRTEGIAAAFSALPAEEAKPRLLRSHMHTFDREMEGIASKMGFPFQALDQLMQPLVQSLQHLPGLQRLMESFLEQTAKRARSDDRSLSDILTEASQGSSAIKVGIGEVASLAYEEDPALIKPFLELAKQTFGGTLINYVATPTWDESRAFLQQHPELLSVAADTELQGYIRDAQTRGDEQAAAAFEQHRHLLRRCREVGVDQAYAELPVPDPDAVIHLIGDFIGQPGWEERCQFVHVHPNILSDTTDDVLCRLIDRAEEQGRKRTVQTMTECRDLLRLCRENGIDAAFAELMDFLNDPARLIELLAQAETWEACGDLLREHPQMLEPDVDDLLARIIQDVQAQQDKRALAMLSRHREFLQRCREMGTDRALALYTGLDVPVPESFQDQVRAARNAERRLDRRQDRAALGEVMVSWARIVAHADFNTASSGFKRACLRNLGAWQEYRLRSKWREATDRTQAIETWRRVLADADAESHEMLQVHKHLGELLLEAFEEMPTQADVAAALDHFRTGFARCEADTPIYGQLLCGLAKSLYLRYKVAGQDTADLQAAISAYESALASEQLTIEDQLTALAGLSLVFSERFTVLGDPADLERAIHYQDRADQVRR